MAVESLIAELSNQVQDELPKTVHESFRGLDSVYNYIEDTSMDVVSADTANMGYKWQVHHLFSGGLAGQIMQSDPMGSSLYDTGEYSESASKMVNTGSDGYTPFPSHGNTPHSGVIKRTLSLHMNTGNFSFPVQWMQHDKLSATHVKQIAMDVQNIGKLRALMEAISFFSDRAQDSGGDDYPVLAQVDGAPTDVSEGLKITIKNGRINYFRPGMLISIYEGASDGGNITPGQTGRKNDMSSTEVLMMVYKVDFLNNYIWVIDPTKTQNISSGNLNTDVQDNDYIVWRPGSAALTANRPLVSWGLEDWIKSSGSLFGGSFSLSDYPHFASKVHDNSDAALDETTLTKTVGSFIDAYGANAPDSIVTTWGVTLKFLQGPASGSFTERVNYERNGSAQNVKAGFQDVGYQFNGRDMRWLISSMCLPNTLYALNLQDGNIKRYVPPKLDTSGDSRIGAEVEFLTKAIGDNTIFKIAHDSSGAPTNMYEAPFWQYRLIAPIDVKACKVTNIAEV